MMRFLANTVRVSVWSETLTDPDNVISAPPKAKESHNRCRKRQDSSDLLTNFKRKTTKLSSDLDFEPDNDNAKKLKIESEPPGHYYCAEDDKIYEQKLVDYFQLGIDLSALYKQWSSADKHFQLISDRFPGIRIMRQDPTENLFAFICSSNNHVSRISGMVNKLSQNYGTKLGTVDGTDLYSFPTADKLTGSKVESHLRELGFGYSYKSQVYSRNSESTSHERPEGFLNSLRDRPYEECITELTKFLGVGRKVADCVALMSLDKSQVVPVDTHVLQIAIRDYSIPGVTKNTRSLTPALHDKIGKYFIDLYGDHAGWAHTVLFAADLKRFSDHKPVSKKTPPAPKKRQKSAKSAK
ncbi:OGG1 [Bugula neritina]|uniref:N-glycosylase/DNA lyase n=1 Tax=Bugula neritina TaxID=10212 RepID=A0A7J7KHU9_BUGNE|nr:OGG1 [Bugula neritina]